VLLQHSKRFFSEASASLQQERTRNDQQPEKLSKAVLA